MTADIKAIYTKINESGGVLAITINGDTFNLNCSGPMRAALKNAHHADKLLEVVQKNWTFNKKPLSNETLQQLKTILVTGV